MIFGPVVYTLEDVKHNYIFGHVFYSPKNEIFGQVVHIFKDVKSITFLDSLVIHLKMLNQLGSNRFLCKNKMRMVKLRDKKHDLTLILKTHIHL